MPAEGVLLENAAETTIYESFRQEQSDNKISHYINIHEIYI